jgi:hypothetical protein
MTVKFGSGAELTFLTEDTDISTMDGVRKDHRSSMCGTLLIPGLKVQVERVEGTYNEQRQVFAGRMSPILTGCPTNRHGVIDVLSRRDLCTRAYVYEF